MKNEIISKLILAASIIFNFNGQILAKNSDASGPIHSWDMTLPDLSKEKVFDGLDMAAYGKFWESWHLVTARYRKDNGEQRFIYANDIAYKAMQEGKIIYPDGAMFGKVAFIMIEDPAFPNSTEPISFTRLQLMKKDSTGHKDSAGWAYGFYARGTGVPYAEEKGTAAACQACHALVPSRDYIFSKPSFIKLAGQPNQGSEKTDSETLKSKFILTKFVAVSKFVHHAVLELKLRSQPTELMLLKMPLFGGSLQESVGPISEYAVGDEKIYVMMDEDAQTYLMAAPLAADKKCKTKAKLLMLAKVRIMRRTSPSDPSKSEAGSSEPLLREGLMCNGENHWINQKILKWQE